MKASKISPQNDLFCESLMFGAKVTAARHPKSLTGVENRWYGTFPMSSHEASGKVMRSQPMDKCPLCQTAGRMLYVDKEDRLFGAGGKWGLSQCQSSACEFVWMNPMPMTEDLGLAYQKYFTHDAGPENMVRRLCLVLYRVAAWIPDWVTGLGKAKKRIQMMYLDDLPAGKLLDVGCGDGRFLHAMSLSGWRVEGVEVDSQAVAAAQKKYGLNLIQGRLPDAGFPADSFDAVTVRHVIEHVPDPVELLSECRRVLRPGGRLVVATPNMASRGHRQFGEHWMGVDLPRHLMLYNPKSMAACTRQAGWGNILIETTAANADTFFTVSLSLTGTKYHSMDTATMPDFARAIKAILSQYLEAKEIKRNPDAGEELILVAIK